MELSTDRNSYRVFMTLVKYLLQVILDKGRKQGERLIRNAVRRRISLMHDVQCNECRMTFRCDMV